jgi:hypothetical protein
MLIDSVPLYVGVDVTGQEKKVSTAETLQN